MERELAVSDIMTHQVVAVREEQNLAQVLAIFERFRFHHLPVLDERKVVGMVSHRDVLHATVAGIDKSAVAQAREERFVERTFVRDLMTTDVLTVRADDSVREAASRMLDATVDSLPVVDEAFHMIGMVTAHDILRMVRDNRF